ncbi:MAG: ABC transporter ATP-binding protein [Candidatus Pseudobacter hemicellulosilyticus]|uniref:ABC transporter ATP-binding protein n=1 Tax=Candidatus Pseudobacter hemicellulosilyticus TaxID=3121375 RepID=A0AAJ5WNF7_9BACT|nr:MAG: ABC transporter ATP-binding protein [Pseudobacter sp.]
MIRIHQLQKKFGRLQALDAISAQFDRGQVVSLIGPNGSGKTTLIKSILGMVKPDSGSIEVQGIMINGLPAYREKIGYMPQIGRYPDNMKIGQLFSMMRAVRKVPEQDLDTELLEQFGLPAIFGKSMRTLSGGTRQKVSAALAFYFRPEILILDEPTAGLDPLSAEILKEKIGKESRKDKPILITSHILSDLEDLTTHVLYLQEGKLLWWGGIAVLRRETGEEKLGRAIARLMQQENKQSSWVGDLSQTV